MNRRELLATGASLIPAAASGAEFDKRKRTTFVLVHGAWHGGWCWRDVAALLRTKGHAVIAPTLTGLGDRRHLARPEIDLDIHVADLLATLEMEDVRNATLVAHSYAGAVVLQAALRLAPHIARIVWLDAVLLHPSESMVSITPKAKADAAMQGLIDSYLLPAPPPLVFGIAPSTPGARWVADRLTPHPIATLRQAVVYRRETLTAFNHLYLRCTQPVFDNTGRNISIAEDFGWPVRAIPTGHDAMIISPAMLVSHIR